VSVNYIYQPKGDNNDDKSKTSIEQLVWPEAKPTANEIHPKSAAATPQSSPISRRAG
jgi:hypothetical protein